MKTKNIKITNENKILIMLAFFSISVGLWGNFRQLWLQNNNLSVGQISSVLSIGTFICALVILILSNKISLNKISKLMVFALCIKSINMLSLFLYDGYNLISLIKSLIIIDLLFEKLIIISVYPLILTIRRDDKLYSKRKLVEYSFRDIGILIGGVLIGKSFSFVNVDYNIFLLISLIFLLIALFIMISITLKTNKIKIVKINNISTIKYIITDKVQKMYLIYFFIGNIAINTGLGLKMLMFTNLLDFSVNKATNYFLIVGIIADIIGIVALKYLTPKNDYITISIKFFIRFLIYTIAFIAGNNIITIVAITWSILISTAYENKTDAPYINRIPDEYQLSITYIRFIVAFMGESVGLFFAGIMYNYGVNYMLGLSAIFMIVQILLAYKLIYLRIKKDNKSVENINNKICIDQIRIEEVT